LNSTILPPDTRTFRDTEVNPGQPYFYKFTVVKTDMTESDFSNIASATPLDTIPPRLTHTPVTSANPGMPLSLSATATDNVHVLSVRIYYRHVGESPYLMQEMTNTTDNNYVVTLPGAFMTPPGVEYYLEAFDGRNYTRSGRAEDPHLIEIDDTPVPTGISPIKGSVEGSTVVVITGSNFQTGAEVFFGGAPASNVVLNSPNQITCTTPAHFPAVVDVRVENPSDSYGTLLNAFTFESTAAQVSMPLTGGGQGDFVTVPVNAANFQGLLAASLEITFDPSILRASSAEPGTLTAGFGYAVNLNTPGSVRISMSNPTMVSGDGSLALITFEVIGVPGSSSDLTIASYTFNDGAIPAEIANGQFNVDNVFSVSGTISYHNSSSPVGGVNLELAGDVVRRAVSLPDGTFEVQGVPAGDYVLTASKAGNVNGITAYDASFVLQHEVGLIDLDDIERIAADVNANGIINSMDAAYILQYAAGLISTPFPGAGSEWKFSPSSRSLPGLVGDVADQDFNAILLGDVSGNWTPNKEHLINIESLAAEAVLTIPDTDIIVDGSELIAVELASQGGEVFSADLVLTYDPAHISIEAVSISPDATSWTLVSNLQEPGIIRIAAAGSVPLDASTELFVLNVKALGQANTSSTIVTSFISLNEGGVPATAVDGVVSISYPSLYLPLILSR
jgi:hypothetical protein